MHKPVQIRNAVQKSHDSGFTLIEILFVLMIVSFLMATLGVTISNMLTSAREAQTIATIEKIDGLIAERQQGLERVFFRGRDFKRYVEKFHEKLLEGNPTATPPIPQLFGLSPKAVEAGARKDFFRLIFPQRFTEMVDVRTGPSPGTPGADGIPDRIQFDEVYGQGFGTIVWNGATPQQPNNHRPETESSELLYFALTRMSTYGVAPVGADAFKTQEVADTDNDGLPEFVDGWGQPLRFYRWPTRLFKPFGLFGMDSAPGTVGVDDDGTGGTDDVSDIGWPGTDDVVIPSQIRFCAGLYMSGLPRAPYMVGSPPVPIPGDYDQLNEDPDDSFGVLLFEAKRLTASGIPMLFAVSESGYHTLDTYHRPLVVSAGADGFLGLYEAYHNEDTNFNGLLDPNEDDGNASPPNDNGNGYLDIGFLGQLINEDAATGDINGNGTVDTFNNPTAAFDDITNHNRRAGGK
ncbi:MAG: type II secretion system protein [Rhodopirellula sp.]|nr:type II secretion system protein [Rhodopirellula sp.]